MQSGPTQQATKRTTATDQKFEGFTEEERAAMKDRAHEFEAPARRGPRAAKADEDGAVLAKIAEMPEPDRGMAERLLWPTSFALTELTAVDEARIGAGVESGELRTELATEPAEYTSAIGWKSERRTSDGNRTNAPIHAGA